MKERSDGMENTSPCICSADDARHDWMKSEWIGYPVCRNCGGVLRRDGANRDKPCRGKVRVVLRQNSAICLKQEPAP